jgi:hypothetical protein
VKSVLITLKWSSQAHVPFNKIGSIGTKLLTIEKVREIEGSDHLHNNKVHNMSSILLNNLTVWNSHLEQYPYNYSSDYTVLLHYTAPDRHGRRCNVEGWQCLFQSHNFATHARLSVFHVTRPCLHILGLANSTLVYCVAHTLLVPMPYANFDMSSPRSSRPA